MSGSNLYPGGDNPVTVNLGLALYGMDEVLAENMILIDTAVGSPISVNGVPVPNANLVNSSSISIVVAGSNVSFVLYTAPVVVLSNSVGNAEIGSSVASVTLSWTLNEAVTSQTLTGPNIPGGSTTVPPGTTTYLVTGPFDPASPTSYTWTIVVGDGTSTGTSSTSLNFLGRRYWGTFNSSSPTSVGIVLTSAQVIGLASTTSGGSDFGNNFDLSVTYNASAGAFPAFAYPASYGTPSHVTVNGLPFSSFNVNTQSFTNASGYTQNYNVILFYYLQNGSSIPTVWA